MNIFTKIFALIAKSINGNDNTKSSTRIQSYFLLIPVITTSIVFSTIEIINAIITWKLGEKYIPTNEGIVAFGMILSHHISVLLTRAKTTKKSSDSKPEDSNNESDIN